MFDAALRIALAPLIERLAEMEGEIEDLRRRADGHIRIGKLTAVDAGKGLCKVAHGEELTTPWIKYFVPAAGDVAEARPVSVGEQCLLLNYAAGDGAAQAVALLGIPSAQFPLASTSPTLHRRSYPDGTEVSYDHASHELRVINGPTSVTMTRSQLLLAIGSATATLTPDRQVLAVGGTQVALAASSLELAAGGSTLTLDAAGIAALGAALTHNNINIGGTHKHPPGTPLSGPPQ